MFLENKMNVFVIIFLASLVGACAGTGTSGSSATPPNTADLIAPSKPNNLLATTVQPTRVEFAWNAATDNVAVSGYRIYKNNVLLAEISATSFLDDAVIANTSYTYSVVAYDAAGNTTASDSLLIATPLVTDTTAPSVPGNLRSTAITSSSISVAWNASTDNVAVTGYRVYRGTTLITTTSLLSYTHTGLTPATAYSLRIDAVDAAGNTASNSITLSTSADQTGFPTILIPITYNCANSNILCVDDTAGTNQEYATIQSAVNDATAGETVIVHAGTYAGFTVGNGINNNSNSGTANNNRVIVTANGNNALINSGGSSQGMVLVSNSDFVTIEGFTIEGASGYCLAARDASAGDPMRGVSFQFNTVRNCGSTNIYMSQAADSLILGNTSYNSLSSHGIYLSNAGSDNVVIKANRCYDNAKNGLHFNGDISNGGDGLHSNITVDSNVFYNNASNGIDADGVHDSLFTNNLIYGNGNRGIRAFKEDSADGNIESSVPAIWNLTFINNTIVNNSGWGIKITHDAGGHVFFNNIIMGNGNACIATDNTNLSATKNIYSSGCSFTTNNEATIMNYATWVSAYSDASIQSSIATVLTNTAVNDFTLATASPAIDTGLTSFVSIAAPTDDIEGVSRPNGSGIDIGAFEK